MAKRSQQTSGSTLVAANFKRLAETFPAGTAPFVPGAEANLAGGAVVPGRVAPQRDDGVGTSDPVQPYRPGYATGYPGYAPAPTYPPPPTSTGGASTGYGSGLPPVSDTAPFVAAEVYNKVAILAALAVAGGTLGYLANLSVGVLFVLLIVAFAMAIFTSFRPRTARITAPLYALVEGLVLGAISRFYEADSHGIVGLAVLFTAAVFAGTLFAYRSGLVHVGRRFMIGTMVATMGLAVVLVAALLGAPVPGASGVGTWSVVIGVVYLVVAVMNLFVDFSFVEAAASAGISSEGEWYAAFTIMLSLVMVYLGMLRILAGRR